jgi:asparagine synthase (glutamine-hydrolysing)
MCGIAGFVDTGVNAHSARVLLRRMSDTLVHRGPDASGYHFEETIGVGFAHRRLSIVDLSPAGHQPMVSASGRFVIIFNGEIYNHKTIRSELLTSVPNTEFRGHSDTEVMLAAFEAHGVRRALESFNGMFAFALLDRRERILHLARDRVGEKPLYFTLAGHVLVFASELKALRLHRVFDARLNHDALPHYFHFGYLSGAQSIVQNVNKVLPGELISVRCGADGVQGVGREKYWSFSDVVMSDERNRWDWSDEEAAIDGFESLLADAVRCRMEADVPLGAFLSGGIDSSTVVAMMQKQARHPVRTFSIGFWEKRFNEADVARRVAERLATDHTELYVTPKQALDVIPHLPVMYDEPFADSSQIPTHLVAAMARRHVTVALSGDGGDELFCGYERYLLAMQLWSGMSKTPIRMRRALAAAIKAIPVTGWNLLTRLFPTRLTAGRLGDRVHKIADRIALKDFDELNDSLMAMWQQPLGALNSDLNISHAHVSPPDTLALQDLQDRMMARDVTHYLPDDILVKVDRATMAVSLEGRMPLLDHRIVELAWRMPMKFKVRGGTGKWILRRILSKYVPNDIVNRPKQGFGVPIEYWLRHELRDWACDLLNPTRLRRDGILNERALSRMLDEHLAARRSWASQLWAALMFQAWYESFRGATSVAPAALSVGI